MDALQKVQTRCDLALHLQAQLEALQQLGKSNFQRIAICKSNRRSSRGVLDEFIDPSLNWFFPEMRFHKEILIFSATDIVNFLGCRHATYLDRRNLDDLTPVAVDDPFLILLQEKGHEHERCYLETLRRTGRKIVEISSHDSLEDRVAKTREAMAAQDEVIYQGALLDGRWHGYADFLFRVPVQSKLGAFSYEPIDTKLSRSAKPKHVLQLCAYAFLLAVEQGSMPPRIHIVLGDGRAVAFSCADFQLYFEVARRRLEIFVDQLPDESVGRPCGHCGQCRWRDRCQAEWQSLDHLSLVANITRSQTSKLETAQVTTMTGLARLAPSVRILKLQTEKLQRLVTQALLQVEKRADGIDRCGLVAAGPGKGFARLPSPSDGDLFFDMEGDPFLDGGLEYLFGFVHTQAGDVRFTPFWGHDRAGEKLAFEQAIDFIVARLSVFPDAHVYHYAGYEESALKRLAVIHDEREAEINGLLRDGRFVDLYRVVREAIQVSAPSYSLKNLEVFYMPQRAGDVKTAAASVVVYEQWRRSGEPKLLQEIADYNEADCRSTLLLRNWLLSLRPPGSIWHNETVGQKPNPKRHRPSGLA
jgi:predicted RecB family nuclease